MKLFETKIDNDMPKDCKQKKNKCAFEDKYKCKILNLIKTIFVNYT